MISFSCKQINDDAATPNEYAAKFIRQLNTSDTFLFVVPKRTRETDSTFFFRGMRSIEKYFGLTPIDKGFDSIHIRIRYGGAMVGDRLVMFSHNGKEWSAEISKITTKEKKEYEDSENVDFQKKYYLTRTIDYKTPKSGWNNFITKLFKLGILSLPNQEDIEGFEEQSANDGVGVSIEVATKNLYRLYGYKDPDSYLDKHWQMRNISEILELIDAEFRLVKMWDYMDETLPDTTPQKPLQIKEMEIQDVKPLKKKGRN